MRTSKGYLPDEEVFPFTGLNTRVPATMLGTGESPALRNVTVTKGVLSKRKGYRTLGGTLSGTVMAEVEFETAAGVKHLVVFTTTKQYRYDGASDAFVNITKQTTGVDVDWTGDETDVISYAIVFGTAGKWIIFTNGKDPPRYWDGSMSKTALWSSASGFNLPDFVTCKTISTFYDHIVIGNVTTSSAQKQSVYWTTALSLTDFLTGSSGQQIITDSSGEIVRLEKLGDRLLAYCTNSISMISYVGGEIIYSFEELVKETQLLSARAIVNLGPFHLYASLENIYVMDGSRQRTPIGDDIQTVYREELFISKRHLSFVYNDAARSKVYWLIPNSANTTLVYEQEYDIFSIRESKWTIHEFADRPTSMAAFSREATILWNSPSISSLTWQNADFTWRQASVRTGFPTRVFGSGTKVYFKDDTLTSDGGKAISAYWDSKDFTLPQVYQSLLGRWIEIELDTQGYEVEVYISVDGGLTFSLMKHLDLNPHWVREKVFIDTVSPRLRVRLVNNCVNSNFSLRWIRVWFRPAGAR